MQRSSQIFGADGMWKSRPARFSTTDVKTANALNAMITSLDDAREVAWKSRRNIFHAGWMEV